MGRSSFDKKSPNIHNLSMGYADVRKNREYNNRSYHKHKARYALERKARWLNDPEYRKRRMESANKARRGRSFITTNSEWYKNNEHKRKARKALVNAVASGKIIRGNCEVCSKPKAHGHHHDYSKPLEVVWLCVHHHLLLHKSLKEKELSPVDNFTRHKAVA